MNRFALLAIAAVLVVAACGDDDATTTRATTTTRAETTTTPTTAVPGAGSAVTVEGFAFVPADLTVAIGTTVTWTNQDGVRHTTTADDDSWDGSLEGGGGSFELTFDAPGTFAYICTLHPSMTGTITVEG